MSEKESTLTAPLTGVDRLANIENYSDPRANLCGDHLTWGNTPFHTGGEQYEVYKKLIERITKSAPSETPVVIQNYFLMHFMSRFYKRQDRNSLSYNDRLNHFGMLSEQASATLDTTLKGDCARPVDLLVLRNEIGMPSIELARLTHPYGEGMDALPEMQAAVDYAVEALGGELCDGDDFTTYSADGGHVRNISSDKAEVGFLVKRKKTVGLLPDGTIIIERSSFFLRIDSDSRLEQTIKSDSRLDEVSAQGMRDVVTQKLSRSRVMNIDVLNVHETADWQAKLSESAKLKVLMPVLLENGEFNDVAIPLSTTVYAYNSDCVEEVDRRTTKDDLDLED